MAPRFCCSSMARLCPGEQVDRHPATPHDLPPPDQVFAAAIFQKRGLPAAEFGQRSPSAPSTPVSRLRPRVRSSVFFVPPGHTAALASWAGRLTTQKDHPMGRNDSSVPKANAVAGTTS